MTILSLKQYRWLNLSVILVVAWLCSVGMTPTAYSEEIPQQAANQDTAITNAATTNNPISAIDPIKTSPTLTMTLQDEDGQPIKDVTVSAMATALSGKEMEQAKTNADGKAVFKHLSSGSYYFFANIAPIRSHTGYDFPAIIKEIKVYRSYYISEVNHFDLSQDALYTCTIKRTACIMFETFLDVFKSDKIVLINKKMGIGQNIPVSSADYIQIYLPMRSFYQIVTVKDGDFDSWIIDFYAHEGLKIELL